MSLITESQLLAIQIPQATLEIIAGCHSGPRERSLVVAQCNIDFLG